MKLKSLFYNSVTVNMPKNIVQFLLGFVLFWVTFGVADVFLMVVSLISFLLTYSSVYLFNDIIDYEDDKKDEEKSKWKLIVTGELSREAAMGYYIIMLLAGISLSLFINRAFTLILIGLVFFNFLHSSTLTRFKESLPKTALNMTIIEFLKYSTGWFALTSNISNFPFWLVLCFSVAYTAVYLFYKFKFNRALVMKNKAIFGTILFVFIFSFGVSFLVYNFSLALILLTVFVAIFTVFIKTFKILKYRMKRLFLIEYIVLPLIIISFLLLMHPSVAELNANITQSITNYSKDVIPSSVMTSLRNITGMENVRDIENSLMNITDIVLDVINIT